MKTPLLTLGLVTTLLAAGCASTSPPNQGTTGGRMDPTRDASSEYGSTDLRSQDLITATDKMAADIASRQDINNPQNPPTFYVGQVINQTSRPHQNFQIFANRVRAVLLASGTRHGLDVRQDRAFVERERSREFGSTGGASGTDTAANYRSRNEYVLTCIVQDLPSRGTNYYLLEYQLVQLVDNASSGPGGGPGKIVWSNFYEVKFQ